MWHCIILLATHNLSLFDSFLFTPLTENYVFMCVLWELFTNPMWKRFHYSQLLFFSQTQRFTWSIMYRVIKVKCTHSPHLQKVHCLVVKTDKQKITIKISMWNRYTETKRKRKKHSPGKGRKETFYPPYAKHGSSYVSWNGINPVGYWACPRSL